MNTFKPNKKKKVLEPKKIKAKNLTRTQKTKLALVLNFNMYIYKLIFMYVLVNN